LQQWFSKSNVDGLYVRKIVGDGWENVTHFCYW
jgi:hypothetical protein